MNRWLHKWRRMIRRETPRRAALDAALLESRIMLSASPVSGAADAPDAPTMETSTMETPSTESPDIVTLASASDSLNRGILSGGAEDFRFQDSTAETPASQQERGGPAMRLELVFVDTAAADYQQLVDDLLANSDPDRELEVYLLDSARDGVSQISETLAGYEDVSAVHLVTHGAAGQIKLGSDWLSLGSLAGRAGEIAAWNHALQDGADLLIYGCNLAASEEGRELAEALGALCGCDVAASVDDTGHAQLGGDWELEFVVGAVETDIAFSIDAQQNWLAVLPNSPPVISLPGSAVNYYIGDPATIIDGAATASDSDSPDFNTGTLTVQFTANGEGNDRLSIFAPGGTGNLAIVGGNNLRYLPGGPPLTIGSIAGGGSGFDPLVITFNGNATAFHVQKVLQSIEFENVSGSPSTLPRTVQFVLTDGDGGTSNAASETIHVLSPLPQIDLDADDSAASGTGFGATFQAGSGPVAIVDLDAVIVDVDSPNLTQLQITITNNSDKPNEFFVYDLSGTGIADSWNSNSGRLTLSGNRPLAEYIQVLRTLQYNNTAADPNAAVRVIEFVATDTDSNSSNTAVASVNIQKTTGLWMTTEGAVPLGTGTPSLSGWNVAEVIEISDPALRLETTPPIGITSGAFSSVRDFGPDMALPGTIDSLHFVSRDILIGGGANTFQLEYGDLLFTLDSPTVVGGVSASNGDILVFEPVDPTNYSLGGTYSILANGILPSGKKFAALTLVEQDTLVGDIVLEAGTFLYAKNAPGADKPDIRYFVPTGVGDGTTTGADYKLIEGDEVDITKDVNGLELVERNVTIGGTTLQSGWIVVTQGGADTGVGSGPGGLNHTEFDLFYLDVTTTTLGSGVSNASATLLFQGGDAAILMNTPPENLTSITFYASEGSPINATRAPNTAPTLAPTPLLVLNPVAEDAGGPVGAVGTLVSSLVDLNPPVGGWDNVTDPDGGAVAGIAVTAADTANGSWHYSIDDGVNWSALGAVGNASARLLAADANTRLYFQPSADYNGTVANAVTFRAWDRAAFANGGLADTSVNGGATSFSAATDTADIDVTPVNDDPSITSPNSANVVENSTAVLTVTATDVNGGVPMYSISGGADAVLFSINAVTGELAFIAAPDFETPLDFGADNVYDVEVTVDDGAGGSDVQAIAVTVTDLTTEVTASLWFTTKGDGDAGGATWTDAEVVQFGDAGDTFDIDGGTTGGTFSKLAGFTAPVDIRAMHYVETIITIGTTGPKFTLNPGDLVMTLDPGGGSVTLNTLDGDPGNDFDADRQDIVVYRPATPGDYSSGQYFMLLNDGVHDGASTYNVHAIALVEADTMVGGTLLSAGTFLVSHSSKPIHNNIYSLTAIGTGVGATQTTPRADFLLGPPLGLDPDPTDPHQIQGLHLLQQDTLFGGVTLSAGTLLVAVNGNDTYAGQPQEPFDIVALNVTQTEQDTVPGTAATGSLFFDGSDIALADAGESLNGLTLVSSSFPTPNNSPTITSSLSPSVNENQTIVQTLTASDLQAPPQVVTFSITGGADQGLFSIDGSNQLVFDAAPDFETPVDADTNNVYLVEVTANDGAGGLDAQLISVTVNAVNDNPPVANLESVTVAQGQQATLLDGGATSVLNNDTDADAPGDTLTAVLDASPAFASNFVLNADGTFRYTHDGSPNFSDSFSYHINDGVNNSATIAVTVTITPPVSLLEKAEFLVNSTTADDQETSSESRGSTNAVSLDPTGDYVVVWTSKSQDGAGSFGVYGQRFDATGAAQGGEFRVNQTTADHQRRASVATDRHGNFVVVWSSENQDGSNSGVYARLYDSLGVAQTNEFLVNVTTAGSQDSPSVAMDSDGDFVVVWEGLGAGDGDGIFARRFDAAGTPQGGEILVNNATSGRQGEPAVAIDANGNFVVVWDDAGGLQGRRFAANAAPLAAQFTIDNSFTAGDGDVAVDADGDFVVVWRETGVSGRRVLGQRYDSSGAPQGGQLVVNTTTAGDQTNPSVDMDAAGNFVVVWEGNGTGDSDGVFYQRFNSSGAAVGGETRINTTVTNTQHMVSVAMQGPSNLVAVWTGEGPGDANGVFARQFAGNTPPTITALAFNVSENTTTVETVAVSDPDVPADTIVWSITGSGADDALFTINATTGALSFLAGPDYELPGDSGGDNIYEVEVRASDGFAVDTRTVVVAVDPVNDNNPVFTSGNSPSLVENSTTVQALTATDSDLPAETISFSVSGGVDAGQFFIAGGNNLTFVAAPDFESPSDANLDNIYEVQITADDGNGGLTVQLVNVAVTDGNDAPMITSATTAVVAENTTFAITVTSTDADGGPPTYSISGGADGGRFAINAATGDLSFAAAPNFESPLDANLDNVYLVQVAADDGFGGVATQNISVTVTNVNEMPVFTSSASAVVAENTTFVIAVTSTDIDGGPPTYSISGGVDGALFAINAATGGLSFAAAPNFEAPLDANLDNVYLVQVAANDGLGGVATQNISVTVTDANEPPAITSLATAVVAEHTTFAITVTSTDADGGPPTYSISGGADGGLFAINAATGGLAFVAAPNFESPLDANLDNVYEVVVHVADGAGGMDSQLISVTVVDANDLPTANGNSYSVDKGKSLSVAAPGVLSGDFDEDSDPLTATLASNAAHGAIVLHPNGSFQYTPDPSFSGTDSFSYQVDDGRGGVAVAIVTIKVNLAAGPPPAVLAASEPPPSPEAAAAETPLAAAAATAVAVETPPAAPPRTRSLAPVGPAPDSSPVIEAPLPKKTGEDDRALLYDPVVTLAPTVRNVLTVESVATAGGFVAPYDQGLLWEDLSELQQQLQDSVDSPFFAAGKAASVTSALTVGYVLWTIRSGWLVTSLLAQMPAWRLVDPLVVLNYLDDESESDARDDDDSLEAMLDSNEPPPEPIAANGAESELEAREESLEDTPA